MTDLSILSGHFRDLAERSYHQNIYTFSNFLGEAELDLFMQMKTELSYAHPLLFGGMESSDRVVLRFGNEEYLGYSLPFPIVCFQIDPLMEKYAEELGHRDYLGACMALGIERELLGDIRIQGKRAYLFCMEHIADYLEEHLSQIRRTNVKLLRLDQIPEALTQNYKTVQILASSERLDGIISKLYNLSRSKSQALFSSGKIFVNGRQCENTSLNCRSGDKISVRGFGKFLYDGVEGSTGKGRLKIILRLYS